MDIGLITEKIEPIAGAEIESGTIQLGYRKLRCKMFSNFHFVDQVKA